MSHSLIYISDAAVSAAVKKAVAEDAASIEHDWWAESFAFYEAPGRGEKGTLAGATKISLPGYTTSKNRYREVDPDDDMFMAAREIAFLFGHLARWSRKHGVTWLLSDSYSGECGRIVKGRPDARANEYLAAMAMTLGDDDDAEIETMKLDGPRADARAARILKRHADRLPDPEVERAPAPKRSKRATR